MLELPRFPDGEMGLWWCLGAVTDRSIRVWLRDPEGGPHTVTAKIGRHTVGELLLRPDGGHDGIAAEDLVLDQPAPNAEVMMELAGQTRACILAPSPGEPAQFTFAFGSCNHPFEAVEDGWFVKAKEIGIYPRAMEAARHARARFMLLVGDQIYSDGVDNFSMRNLAYEANPAPTRLELLDAYRQLYRGYFAESSFRAVLEALPTYLTWDNHEIFDNWGSVANPEPLERTLFEAAGLGYREYQHVHNSGTTLEDAPPFDYSFWYGDVGFLVLDMRSCRNYGEGRVLSDQQWSRLDGFLREAAGRGIPTVFVGLTIPAVHFSPAVVGILDALPKRLGGGTIRDRWNADHLRGDRRRLLDSLFEWQSGARERQAVILSGDVHAGAAFTVHRKCGPGRLHQWTSSPLTVPLGPGYPLFNLTGTPFANLGEHAYHSVRLGVETWNNFGMVKVTPLGPGLGHQVGLDLYGYDPETDRLRIKIQARARPGPRGG